MRPTLLLLFTTLLCTGLTFRAPTPNDVAQTPELVVPISHTKTIMAMATDPGGGRLATSSLDETVKIWDTGSGRELYTFRPGETARDLAFTADGKTLAVAAFNQLHLLSTDGWAEKRSIKGWFLNGVKAHPTKNELYYATQKHNSTGEDPIQLYSVSLPNGNPRLLATVPIESSHLVTQLDISPDGSTLLLVQTANGYLVPTTGGSAETVPNARRFTPDGDLFFVQKGSTNGTFGVTTTGGDQRWALSAPASQVAGLNLVHTMGFDLSTGRFYWKNMEGRIASGDYRSGSPTMFEMPENLDGRLTVSTAGELFVATKNPFRINAYPLPSLANPRIFGEAVLSPAQLAGTAPADGRSRLSWGNGQIATLEFEGQQIIPNTGPAGYFPGRLYYSQRGNLLTAASSNSRDLYSYQDPTRQADPRRYKTGFDAPSIAARPNTDGSRLLVVTRKGLLFVDALTDKAVGRVALPAGYEYYSEAAALSPTGDRALVTAHKTASDGKTDAYTRLISWPKGDLIWEIKARLDDPAFSTDGQRIYADTYQFFVEYDSADGRLFKKHPIPNGRFPARVSFRPDGRYATYVHDFDAYVYDFTTDRETRLDVPGEEDIAPQITTFFHDDFVVLAGREGVLRIFDLRNKKYVAALVRYADSDDWALIGADGRFDATPGAMQKMYYRVGNELVALEQLFGGFYTPGLAAEIFNRLPPGSTPPAPSIGALRPAPGVELSYREGTRGLGVEDDEPEQTFIQARTRDAVIVVTGDARGDRISELRLYRNGKLLGEGQRGLVVEDDAPDPAVTGPRSYRVRLLPGTNNFRAVALNSQRTESRPAYLTVNYDGPANAPEDNSLVPATAVPASGPAGEVLHLVTVGIDKYANPEYNLNYATADAGAMDQTLASRMSKLAGNIVHHVIRDDGATQAGILERMQAVIDGADANDLFVFYFAGHGLVPDRSTGKFYLIPHDVTEPYHSTSGLAQLGISADNLQRLSASISAERQLFILDACQSGSAVAALGRSMRGAAEEKAIASLARTTGTHWLTATDSDQLAAEFDALGHGAFTYVLLEGLGGKAAGADGELTIQELKGYLELRLPELTREYSGVAQYPSSFGFGRDFILSR